MRSVGRTCLLGVLFVLLASGVARATAFDFNPIVTYKSVPASATLVDFYPQLKSNFPGGDDLMIVFDSHLPDGWFAQFCQTSTGICYPDDAPIHLRNDQPDTLRIDFFPPPGDEGKGWADVRIYRVMDPTTWVEATFAVGHGVTLPASNYNYKCADAFRQANPFDVVEFFSQIRSNNAFDDSLICQIETQLPSGWFAQYCQTSTGICYFGRASVPLSSYIVDTLRVDFFCNNPDPGIGNVRIKTQSAANPAIWRALPFRVRVGDIPASAEEGGEPGRFAVRAMPNPMQGETDLQLALDRPGAVRIEILDVTGRIVYSRALATLPAGLHRIRWDGSNDRGERAPSGTYFYRVGGDGMRAQGKLTLDR